MTCKRALGALAVFACAAGFPRLAEGQTTRYVDINATGPSHDGTSWCNAFLDLQGALAAAQSGDQIRVAGGVYKPDGGTHNRSATFTLKSGVAVLGGYAGCGAADPGARDYALNPTVLSGDLLGNDGPDFANNADNSLHVVTYSDPAATNVLIEGFTVSGGNADGANPANQGGGIHIRKGTDKCLPGGPTIRDCIVENNSGEHHGAINDHGLSTTIENCVIRHNHAHMEGGGLQIHSGSPTIRNCQFIDNESMGQGGGAWVGFDTDATCTGGSQAKFYNCVFEGNEADSGGGLYAKFTTSLLVQDCEFHGNSATAGAGAYLETVANASINRCQFVENTSPSEGGGVYNASGTNISYTDCEFRGNSAATYAGGMRNRETNPTITGCLFVGNSSGGNGGALHNRISSPTFDRCAFLGNRCETEGAASFNTEGSSVVFKNSSFSGNHSVRLGGVMSNHEGSFPSLRNCTLSANSAVRNGSAIINDSQSGASLINSVVWGHTGTTFFGGGTTATYSNIQGGLPGIGNISTAPLFTDANGADNVVGTDDDDLRLMIASPGINVGDPGFAPASGEEDLAGGPRLAGCRVDMGAHETGTPQTAADFNDDKTLDLADFANFQLCFLSPAQHPSWHDACVCVFDFDDSGVVDLPDYSQLPWPAGPCFSNASCDDGDACNGVETCSAGVCQPGTPLSCGDGNPCTNDSCSNGACVHANNAAPCNDNDACTTLDVCSGGSCVGSAPLACNDNQPCTDDSCNPSTGCVFVADNGNSCGDGNVCNGVEHCGGGVCQGGAPPVCNDNKPCTDDTCDPILGCVYDADDTNSCGDGNACNGAETCIAGNCIPGLILPCNDGNRCTDDHCDETTGCVFTNDDSNSCSDGDLCNGLETCSGGSCVSGAELTCDDGEACTDDSCDPEEGCVFTANDANSCSDSNPCTVGDGCSGGACLGGSSFNCSSSNTQCATASCDSSAGAANCDILTPVADGTDCNDGLACTVGESCASGACTGGESPDCSTFETDCAAASCDPNGLEGNCDTLTARMQGTPCDQDHDLCTVDACDLGGNCVPQSNVECPGPTNSCDGGKSCDSFTGQCVDEPEAPAGTGCDADSNLCTIEECDGAGSCELISTVECPGPTGVCDGGQECDALTGACVDSPDADAGTTCEADESLCTEDECDGSGSCIQGQGCELLEVCVPKIGCLPE